MLSDVEDVCDRVVIYYGGRIQAKGTLQELLTTPDVTRITTPVLSKETMSRVLEIIRSEVREEAVAVDNPTQNLESYFLGVVERARSEETTTSGALAGGVADYLKVDGEDVQFSSDKILNRLTKSEDKSSPSQPLKEVSTASIDHNKLSNLTEDKRSELSEPEITDAERSRQRLDAANDKLSRFFEKDQDSSKS